MQNGLYADALLAQNLDKINASSFAQADSWWYRATFTTSASVNERTTLRFEGINYRANIWVNGVLVASNSTIVGTFRHFDLDISEIIAGRPSALAIEIFRPYNPGLGKTKTTDLAITFVDWAPQSPDWQGGLWLPVSLLVTGPLSLRYPLVNTTLLADATTAALDIAVDVTNHVATPATGMLTAMLRRADGTIVVNASLLVSAPALSTATVILRASDFPALTVRNASLWWPYQMGEPHLHDLVVEITDTGSGNAVSDAMAARVGLRQTASRIDTNGHLQLFVNGVPVLVRGGGWAPDLFLRTSAARTRAELGYVRGMGLNTVRLEGKLQEDDFFDAADEMGILTMPGWCCCDAWQNWGDWTNDTYTIASASMASQTARLRRHASVLAFFTSSDELPPPRVEQLYIDAAAASNFPNPLIAAASTAKSTLTGPTGVKMSGPYRCVLCTSPLPPYDRLPKPSNVPHTSLAPN